MALPKKPDVAIFPIVVHGAGRGLRTFLGTAFFLHLGGTFMTARHVLDPPGLVLSPGESLAALMQNGSIREITDIRLCSDLDIAIGKISPPEGIVPLGLIERDPAANLDLITYEFSNVAGQRVIPSTRKGYVVSTYPYRSRHYAQREARFLELSFPARPGASGAPILVEKDGMVAGMIVDHVDSQVGSYKTPMGMAIDWRHLRDFGQLQGLGLRLFMTANLDTILASAHEKLTEAAIQGARGAGIVRDARVVAVVPRREESQLEPPEADEGDSRRIICSLEVRVEVQGWGGTDPLGAGSWLSSVPLAFRLLVDADAQSLQGELYGLEVTHVECQPLADLPEVNAR